MTARPTGLGEDDVDPIAYRYIPEGSGGTYTFTQETTPYIGTSKCQTCVGVYFAIDDKICFAAHINVDTTGRDGHTQYIVNNKTAAKIKNEIVSRLKQEQQTSQWGPVSDKMRTSLIMVCPKLEMGFSDMVGSAVSNGLQEWLQVASLQRPRAAGGFVIQHPAGVIHTFAIEASSLSWQKQEEAENRAWSMSMVRVEQD
ncbi:hypothetical protein LTR85_010722 [Meristemomyces frigidus]|nr:hypothetical protein LTR85_010722 [Meristemomyces frigidus]